MGNREVYTKSLHTRTASERQQPLCTNGMVTSPHCLATEAGLAILRKGGNALDAAIACATTLTVVYSHMTSLGGDAFWLIYNNKRKTLQGINGSGRAARKATIAHYKDLGLARIPERGPLASITVPGFLSAVMLAKRYSEEHFASTLSLGELFSSAQQYAEEGYPVSTSFAKWSAHYLERHAQDPDHTPMQPDFAELFFKNGQPYHVGERFIQKDLAKSLERLSTQGCEDFYFGELATRITMELQIHGGILTQEDFAQHTANFVEPLSVSYRDYKAYNLPPNSQGMTSLAILNILNNFDLTSLSESSYYHLLIEATKLAFADRDTYLSDPEFTAVPAAELLSKAYGQKQAARISCGHASAIQNAPGSAGDTCWFGIVDRFGNAVSAIQSIFYDFGSSVVPRGTGILLQNRGSFFSLDPNHVNHLEPGKRTFHTLNPAMLMKDERPCLVYGTMGGEGQPQTQAQIVTRIMDYGMTPNDAIRAPRFLYGRAWGKERSSVQLEDRIPQNVQDDLKRLGHPVECVESFCDAMGHAGAVLCHENGVLQGGSDPRSDGLASGY